MEHTGEHIEKSFIGSLILRPALYYEVSMIVKTHMIENARMQVVIENVYQQLEEKNGFDINICADKLERDTNGDITYAYLHEFINHANTKNIVEYANEIRRKYLLKELVLLGDYVSIESRKDIDPSEVLTEIDKRKDEIINNYSSKKNSHVGSFVVNVADNILEAKESGGLRGLDTGWNDLNRAIGGYRPGKLMVLAARPGMGKSYLTAVLIYNAAVNQVPVAMYLLEMTCEEYTQIFISIRTGIPNEKLEDGNLNEEEQNLVLEAADFISRLPIYLEDRFKSFVDIHMDLRFKIRKHGVKMAVIDYLQLCTYPGMDRSSEYEVATKISGKLKQMSMPGDCNCFVLALSQLSRSVEQRGGMKRPMMSDLRSTGAIEQDADIIGFIYRAAYYGILEDEEGNSLKDVAEVMFSKIRGRKLATLKKRFWEGIFSDLPADDFTNDIQPAIPANVDDNAGMNGRRNDDDEIPF